MRILKILDTLLSRRSSNSLISYYRKKGVTIGEGCIIRDPLFTKIDTTRPYLIKIGDHVDMNRRFEIWTHDWGGACFVWEVQTFF